MANEISEIRYDLDTTNCEGLSLSDMLALLTLSGRWQYRNHLLRMRRLELAAQGPQVLA